MRVGGGPREERAGRAADHGRRGGLAGELQAGWPDGGTTCRHDPPPQPFAAGATGPPRAPGSAPSSAVSVGGRRRLAAGSHCLTAGRVCLVGGTGRLVGGMGPSCPPRPPSCRRRPLSHRRQPLSYRPRPPVLPPNRTVFPPPVPLSAPGGGGSQPAVTSSPHHPITPASPRPPRAPAPLPPLPPLPLPPPPPPAWRPCCG